MSSIIYYGTIKCQALKKKDNSKCSNGAYWQEEDNYLCGVHSKSSTRVVLPKLPKKEKDLVVVMNYQEYLKSVKELSAHNKENKIVGDVTLLKLQMRKSIEQLEGYITVYPNYKDQNRKDGFGCASLSPMSMGKIHHNQPGLPPSLNLENFHQGSKLFLEEAVLNSEGEYVAGELYYTNRLAYYNDSVPHRRKFKKDPTGNKTLAFIWVDADGKEHYLRGDDGYVQSRQFYCNFYERIALQDSNYKLLKQQHLEGVSFRICGYDARPMLKDENSIEKEYLDPFHPFGHEKVLFTMLVLDSGSWPWRKLKTFEF